MQTRPDHTTLLEAVAQFLLAEVSAKLDADKALQFRVLIAANLATVVSAELTTEASRFNAEVTRLSALVPDVARGLPLDAPERPKRLAALDTLNRALVEKLRGDALSDAELQQTLQHLLATATETLAATNPRFDLTHGN